MFRRAWLLLSVFPLACGQEFPALPRGRGAAERLEPQHLEAVHQARERLARERKILPAVGVYREYRAVMHIHAEDSNHTFGTRAEVLKAAKETGVSVVLFTDHRGPNPDTWQGMRDGVLFLAGAESDHLQNYPQPAPGLKFHSHVEEQMEAPVDGMDGMEIYNRHSDSDDDKDLVVFLRDLKKQPNRMKEFQALARSYPDEVYGAGGHYWPEIFARWDQILETRKFPGVSANDAHQNQVLDDGAGGKLVLDPYVVAFRNTVTHILARSLDEKSVQDSLRAGRSFVSHDWLCDATGFTFVGGNNLGVYQMGDVLPMAGGTRLEIATPVAATLRVIHKGKTIAQKSANRLTVPVTDPGAYRVEAWLEVDGEPRPWIYSNPIYVERLDPATMRLPPSDLSPNVEAALDLTYVEASAEEKQKLDVYRPKGAAKRPVLFFVHGGAWRNGDRRLYPALGNRIAKDGYVVVIPSYRLAPKSLWPAQMDDVSAAFAWTVKNVAQYGGDPARIVIAGQSAGGHLVSLLATRTKEAKAVVSVSGVYRISSALGVFGEDPAVRADASPMTQVHSGLPPFVVAYCQWDYLTLPQQAEAFHDALRSAGNESQLVYIPRENHISEVLHVTEPENVMARTFLETLRRVDNQ